MNYILVIWTIVSVSYVGDGGHTQKHMDWRPIGDFSHIESCNEAAKLMNIRPGNFRCIPKYKS